MAPEESPGVDVEAYARQAAVLLEIEISDDDWPPVIANMETIFAVAHVLLDEPIADDVPPIPAFEA